MPKLYEMAKLIRSKNAGPFQLTIDILFDDSTTYERVLESGVLTPGRFAALYSVPADEVHVIPYQAAHAVKITIPRRNVSGDLADGDIMGGQQYGPLVELEIPDLP